MMEVGGHFLPHQIKLNKVLIQIQKCVMVLASLEKRKKRMNLSTLSPQVVFYTSDN